MLKTIIDTVERKLDRITLYTDVLTGDEWAEFLRELKNDLTQRSDELDSEYEHKDTSRAEINSLEDDVADLQRDLKEAERKLAAIGEIL